jgi:hypothetical protein
MSSIRAAYSTSTEPRLTFPLMPRCYRRSLPPPRVTEVLPSFKNLTTPPHLHPLPWTAHSGEPRSPPPCPTASLWCPCREGETSSTGRPPVKRAGHTIVPLRVHPLCCDHERARTAQRPGSAGWAILRPTTVWISRKLYKV